MFKKIYKYCLGAMLICLLSFISKNSFSQSPAFTIGSASNVTSSTITIPVTGNNFTQILAWQGSINWDNSKLNYQSVSSAVSQLSGIQFNASVASNTGRLSFIWIDNNVSAQTIANNTVLFTITFSVVSGAAGNSDVFFTNNPTQLLVSNANGVAVSGVNYINGSVGFSGTSLIPEFTIGSLANINGSTITIPVTCKNFIQILAWQGSINWDNSKFTFQSIGTPITELTGMQFANSVSGSTGQVGFTWAQASLLPQTIPDNSVLFSITLNVVSGATGTSDILFASTPTQLILSSASGSTISNVMYRKGTLSFPGATLAPEFILGSIYDVNTSTITVPVTTKYFTQLLACQGSINWDNTKLSFQSVSTPIAQLSGMLFNATVNGTTGRLSFLWTDNNLQPQTILDNVVLFTITYNVLGGNSGLSNISFTNVPTTLITSNASGNAIENTVYTNNVITFSGDLCFGGSTTVTSSITGAGYQWQVNTGGGFSNISNNANYTGTTTSVLGLNSMPAEWAGYQYRCLVNGATSNVFTLKFRNYFTGAVNNTWENINNWSCGSLPDSRTDVVINTGTLTLNSNVTCKSITVNTGATFIVTAGFVVTIISQ